MNRKAVWILLLAICCAILIGHGASSVRAQTRYYVNQATGNDLNDGRTWATAFKTLQRALSVAQPGDEIWVARGVYYPTEGLTPPPSDPRSATFNIKSIKLIGGFAGNEGAPEQRDIEESNLTVLSGDIDKDKTYANNSYVVVTIQGNATLDGFMITGGSRGYSSLCNYGGGIYVGSGYANLLNVKLIGNKSSDALCTAGGGALALIGSGARLENVEIRGNETSGDGGGIYVRGGNLTIINSTITENKASRGGGIYVESTNSSLELESVSIANNTANYGGGIYLSSYYHVKILNSTLSYNTAPGGKGGGIYKYYYSLPSIIVVNTTIFKNSATTGGGIYNDGSYSGNFAELKMAIVAGNTGGDCVSRGAQISAQYSLIQDSDPSRTCGLTTVGTNLIGVDPKLELDLRDLRAPGLWGGRLVHLPLPDSPVINAGPNTDCPPQDQLGFPRPLGDRCDIGAIEFTFTKRSPSDKSTNQPLNITLTWDSFVGAQGYEVCVDTVDNNACDTGGPTGGWKQVGNVTSWTVSGLAEGMTYYWQVRAVNAAGTTEANNGAWWRFSTQVSKPGAFSKVTPANGATGLPTSVGLQWQASVGAQGYEVCVDTVDNNACDTGGPTGGWKQVGNVTSWTVSGLAEGMTYYWQVRAVNAAGTTEANNGAWWRFSTQGAFYRIYLPLVLRNFGTGSSETLIYETFEGSFPGSWQLYSNTNYEWGKRSCRPYNGSYSGWSVGGGVGGSTLSCSANYPNNVETWMIYGPFSLIGMNDADMTFKLWLNTEQNYDFMCWGASLDGYSFYVDCLSGNSGGWIDVELDLRNVPGLGNLMGRPNVWVSLLFMSDSSINMQGGAYVDNIRIRRCLGECPTASSTISVFGEGLSRKLLIIRRQDSTD